MKNPLEDNPVIGFDELSKVLGVGSSTLRSDKCRGRLPVSVQGHVGPVILFNRAEAQAYAAVLKTKRERKDATRKA